MREKSCYLKYTPAAVFGFLLFAWPFNFGITVNEQRQAGVFVRDGNVDIWIDYYHPFELRLWPFFHYHRSIHPRRMFGHSPSMTYAGIHRIDLRCPVPLILGLLLPLAIGPLINFRFPLWSWFAYIAWNGAALAYLRLPGYIE